MARSYRGIRPKRHFVYSVDEVLGLFDISRNTVTNWRNAGLQVVDDAHPILITGAELERFHRDRKQDGKHRLKTGQFNCRRCATMVYPDIGTVSISDMEQGQCFVRAECPDCMGTVRKFFSRATCEAILACQKLNTPLQSLDEEDSPNPGSIGKPTRSTCRTWTPGNERVLYLYLKWAGQFHPRTVDAIMTAVRGFETFHRGKRFDHLKVTDVSAWRDHILKRGVPGSSEGLSRSTIRHRASHLRQFLKWLVKQDGYRRLNPTLCDYANLPKGQSAKLQQPPPRPYPTMEQAAAMVQAMPAGSLIQRRDRAVVATAFLTGLRAGSLAALRFGDIDACEKDVRVDARHVRAKNGKSQQTFWFAVDPVFETIVEAWLAELARLDARPDDALFPPNDALEHHSFLMREAGRPIAGWKSGGGIARAFKAACDAAGLQHYTPHTARHCLVALGKEICHREDSRDAWSMSLGHETRQVTVSNYAKMTQEQHKSVMARMRQGDIESENEKDLLLALHEHRLARGTPEFERAERLHEARMKRHRGETQTTAADGATLARHAGS
jgi:integrase